MPIDSDDDSMDGYYTGGSLCTQEPWTPPLTQEEDPTSSLVVEGGQPSSQTKSSGVAAEESSKKSDKCAEQKQAAEPPKKKLFSDYSEPSSLEDEDASPRRSEKVSKASRESPAIRKKAPPPEITITLPSAKNPFSEKPKAISDLRAQSNRRKLPTHPFLEDNRKCSPVARAPKRTNAESSSEDEWSPPAKKKRRGGGTVAKSQQVDFDPNMLDKKPKASPPMTRGRSKRRKNGVQSSPTSNKPKSAPKRPNKRRTSTRRDQLPTLPDDMPIPVPAIPNYHEYSQRIRGIPAMSVHTSDTYKEYDGIRVNVDRFLENCSWPVHKLLQKRTQHYRRGPYVEYLCQWKNTWETRGMYRALKKFKKVGYPVTVVRKTKLMSPEGIMVDLILCRWEPGWEPESHCTHALLEEFELAQAAAARAASVQPEEETPSNEIESPAENPEPPIVADAPTVHGNEDEEPAEIGQENTLENDAPMEAADVPVNGGDNGDKSEEEPAAENAQESSSENNVAIQAAAAARSNDDDDDDYYDDDSAIIPNVGPELDPEMQREADLAIEKVKALMGYKEG